MGCPFTVPTVSADTGHLVDMGSPLTAPIVSGDTGHLVDMGSPLTAPTVSADRGHLGRHGLYTLSLLFQLTEVFGQTWVVHSVLTVSADRGLWADMGCPLCPYCFSWQRSLGRHGLSTLSLLFQLTEVFGQTWVVHSVLTVSADRGLWADMGCTLTAPTVSADRGLWADMGCPLTACTVKVHCLCFIVLILKWKKRKDCNMHCVVLNLMATLLCENKLSTLSKQAPEKCVEVHYLEKLITWDQ